MKQVVQNYRTGELRVEDVPPPALERGGVLVANSCSLISAGTETATINFSKKSLVSKALEKPENVDKVLRSIQREGVVSTYKMAKSRLSSDALLGYSSAGTIVSLGEMVEGFHEGQRVACAGQNYASHAELIYVPKNLCVPIPTNVTDKEAAFVAVGAIALQAVRQINPEIGSATAVIGLGLVGQLVAQLLRANGCQVFATDLNPWRNKIAREHACAYVDIPSKFKELIETHTGGRGVDHVVIAASAKSVEPLKLATQIARKKGILVALGAFPLEIERNSFYEKELELRMSTSYGPGRYDRSYEELGNDYPYNYVRWTQGRNMEAFLKLISQKQINVLPLSTHAFKIENATTAYETLSKTEENHLGIHLTYTPQVNMPRRIDTSSKTISKNQHAVGIIGLGNHLKDRILPELSKFKEFGIAAVCSKTGAKAKQSAKQLGANFCTTDFNEIVGDNEIGTIFIGTRHDSHAQLVTAALEANKNVFVEKPLCLSTEELSQISTVFQNSTGALMVGFNRRYSSHAVKIKEFFSQRGNQALSMIYRVNAGRLPDKHWIYDPDQGGRLIGEACHFIDFMQYICGNLPIRVSAEPIPATQNSQDNFSILIKFADGSTGTILYTSEGATSMEKEFFEVFGAQKSAQLTDFRITNFFDGSKRTKYASRKQDKGFANELSQFRALVLGKDSSAANFSELYASTLATILANQSLISGGEPKEVAVKTFNQAA